MIHELKYVNTRGDAITFGGSSGCWHFGETDIFNIEQDYEEVGGIITSFGGSIRKMSLRVIMRGGSLDERNRFIDVVSYDQRAACPGTLYAGASYMRCYVKDIEASGWHYSDGSYTAEITVVSDKPVWVRKHSIVLAKIEGKTRGGLNYPRNYPHNYGYSAGTTRVIENPFMLPAKVDIAFPGPCADPYVIIGGNRYQVLTSATKGQLIIVRGYPQEGNKKQILLRDVNGSERSILSAGVREANAQIFAEIPVGSCVAAWTGGYNINVDMYEERLSPWWT